MRNRVESADATAIETRLGRVLPATSLETLFEPPDEEINFCDILNRFGVRRNDVMHKAEKVDERDASLLINVAFALVEAVVLANLDKNSLRIHMGKIIYKYYIDDNSEFSKSIV
ncbi:MAG: hypothetical protein WCC64_07960 [Aliidongia sp.]